MEELCFCGSGKLHTDCHPYIHEKSFVASLYRLQNELDLEIMNQMKEKDLSFPCKAGCCECCSRCFCVSQTEFAQIYDEMVHHWQKEKIEEIIQKSERQWNTLKTEAPIIAQKLQGRIALQELLTMSETKLPFPCIFLDESNCCSIYKLRPLACLMHGVAYSDFPFDIKPCSKLSYISDLYEAVDLTHYDKKIAHYLFMRYGAKTIIRRPAPLFYYFHLLFHGNYSPKPLTFCHDLLTCSEEDYIQLLIESV